MVTKTILSNSERQLLKDAPHWLQIALRASKGGGGIGGGGRDPKIVSNIMAEYKADTPLVREVIAARDEKSEAKESASFREATQTFEQIADILDQKVDPKEADEFRVFLLDVAQKIAESSREGLFGLGKRVSDQEAEDLKAIAAAFRATPEDKKRREADVTRKQREEETRQATAAAQKKAAEEARQREEAAKKQREAAAAQKKAAEEAKQREEEAKKQREAVAAQKKAAEEAKQREEEAKKQREAEAARQATAAAQKKAAEEARQREEEAKKQREAEAARQATAAAQKKAAEEPQLSGAQAKKQPQVETTRAVAQEQIYEVKSGDSLSKIAMNLYGDMNRWQEIFEANRDTIKDPNLIQPGQKLRIPRQGGAGTTRAVAQEQIYEVKSGDSLSKIAKNLYGDANRWSEIFEANRDTIKDPNLIRPGQKLRIP